MTNVVADVRAEAPNWNVAWTRDEGADRARQLFRDSFAYEPATVKSAPGRVTIIGEHTDYSSGLALTTVLDHRTYVGAARRDDDTVRVVSTEARVAGTGIEMWTGKLADVAPGSVASWPAYAVGVLWALVERGFVGSGIDIAIDSCVPMGVGLASSGALTAAVALAADACWGLALDSDAGRIELAELCQEAESTFVGVPTAGLDQHTVLRCRPGEALLIDFRSPPPRAYPHPLYFPEYGLTLLIINTRAPHDFSDGQYAERWAACQAACAELNVGSLREVADAPHALRRVDGITEEVTRKRARHVVTEIERVRLVSAELSGTAPAHERFVTIGKALYRSHASLDVDYEISTPALNDAVDAAFRAGALGARLLGGGYGGCAMALVRRTQVQRTAELIADAFAQAGHEPPEFLMS